MIRYNCLWNVQKCLDKLKRKYKKRVKIISSMGLYLWSIYIYTKSSNYIDHISLQSARKVLEYLVDVRDKLKDDSDFNRKKKIDESLRRMNTHLVSHFCINQ